MLEHEFPHLIEKQFDRLYREVTEVESELVTLNNINRKKF